MDFHTYSTNSFGPNIICFGTIRRRTMSNYQRSRSTHPWRLHVSFGFNRRARRVRKFYRIFGVPLTSDGVNVGIYIGRTSRPDPPNSEGRSNCSFRETMQAPTNWVMNWEESFFFDIFVEESEDAETIKGWVRRCVRAIGHLTSWRCIPRLHEHRYDLLRVVRQGLLNSGNIWVTARLPSYVIPRC